MKNLDLKKVKVAENMTYDVSEFASDMIEKKKFRGSFLFGRGWNR